MRKILAYLLASVLVAAGPAYGAGDKPLVIVSGKVQQIPSNTTLQLNAGSTSGAPVNIGQGAAPTSPNNGDCWITSSGLFCYIAGSTVGPYGAGGGGTVSTTGSPASGNLTKFSGSTSITNGDLSGDCTTSGALAITCTKINGDSNIVFTDANQTFTKSQRGTVQTLSLSSSTFTPNFDNGNNFTATLVHATCPCTLANPSTTPVAGQSGVIEVIQSASGSDLISTWGSDYIASGGTSTITLSTGASAKDYISYYVADSTHIVLSLGVTNASH